MYLDTSIILIYFLSLVISAIIGLNIGSHKRRGGLGFILGLLFGVFGLLIIAILEEAKKICNHCGNRISETSRLCPICREGLYSKQDIVIEKTENENNLAL